MKNPLEIPQFNAYINGAILFHPVDLFNSQIKLLIMKPHIHTFTSGSGSGSRSAMTGALQYMSERQTQAYLMARDVIRRIQRTSSIVGPISEDSVQRLRAANRRQNSH